MARVKGPILSLSASGSIAKSQVYASWRGVAYARQHVDPANPQTAEQTATRTVFRSLSQQWKVSPALATAPFTAAAQGRPFTNRNSFVSANLPVLRGETDMDNFVGSPGAKGGIPGTVLLLTPGAMGSGELTVDLTTTDAPPGWTLSSVVAVAFAQRDPSDDPVDFPVAGEDLTPTAGGVSSVLLTGLGTGVKVASAWPVWTKPDGTLAYGPSLTDNATLT